MLDSAIDSQWRPWRRLPAVLTALSLTFAGGTACAPKAPSYTYDVPLQAGSPWPKFRRDAIQDALSPVTPAYAGGKPWSYQTGKGIFSSPVVSKDGTILVGSADRYFYALDPSGKLKWNYLTGEIIDSAGLIDAAGNVYFGSGDGYAYAFNAETGAPVWKFQADDPATIHTGSSYIRWFEGNVAIDAKGRLIIPNDNNVLYALDRMSGQKIWSFTQSDECWSLPAINVATGNMFFGNDSVDGAVLGGAGGMNVYAVDANGRQLWTDVNLGSTAASPVLTSDGAFIVGSFDGYVYSYDQHAGTVRWKFPTRDHIYASPAFLPDGTIIQASTDGTVYALDPGTGKLKWSFDILDPIRSSPAVDGEGNIYVGTGGGQLLVLTKDGQRRFAITLISQDRNDLNSSPALGSDAVYLGGEDGNIYSVPYDYCLHAQGDSRCTGSGGSTLPADGVFLWYTTPFGTPTPTPPAQVDANDALAFSLYVRQGGHTQVALIDSSSVNVTVTPPQTTPPVVTVSGDRRFLTIVPQPALVPDASGNVTLSITGQYLENFNRTGLVLSGGTAAGTFTQNVKFSLTPDQSWALPLAIPQTAGAPAGVWEMYRLAAPLPTILPSYNQIGFDSLHYLVGMVEGNASHAIAWVVGGKLAADQNTTEFDPTTQSVFPLELSYDSGRVTMLNESSFSLIAMNATISFDSFRLNARVDSTGTSLVAPHLTVSTNCAHIPTFGAFLSSIGFCNPQTDELVAFGSVLLRPFSGSPQTMPAGVGTVSFSVAEQTLTATLTGSTLKQGDHVYSLLLVDEATGHPVPVSYGIQTTITADASGVVQSVKLNLGSTTAPSTTRTYLLVDAYPVAVSDTVFAP